MARLVLVCLRESTDPYFWCFGPGICRDQEFYDHKCGGQELSKNSQIENLILGHLELETNNSKKTTIFKNELFYILRSQIFLLWSAGFNYEKFKKYFFAVIGLIELISKNFCLLWSQIALNLISFNLKSKFVYLRISNGAASFVIVRHANASIKFFKTIFFLPLKQLEPEKSRKKSVTLFY